MNKELSIRVAGLFTPKPWKHDPVTSKTNGCVQVCVKCKSEHAMMDGSIYEKTCPVPDPVDITDLGKALECFRGFGLPTLMLLAINGVFALYPHKVPAQGNKSNCFKSWLVYEATAEQIWEICCLAKESE